jgi:NAD(P)-dependent dehydrogenase (short-subunit alcohol dehydrogenase family)
LPRSERLRVLTLDVTKPGSIAAALEASGPIDALVNNAGVGLIGAFEATPMPHARKVFETNTFGVMAMIQAVLPQFRRQRLGSRHALGEMQSSQLFVLIHRLVHSN